MKIKIQNKDGHRTIDLNRRKAIRQRCLNCAGWIPKEVANCEFSTCPLYQFRSGKGKQNPKVRDKAIRDYCLWCMNNQRSEVVKCVSCDCPIFPFRKNGIDCTSKIESLLKMDHIGMVSEKKVRNEWRNSRKLRSQIKN